MRSRPVVYFLVFASRCIILVPVEYSYTGLYLHTLYARSWRVSFDLWGHRLSHLILHTFMYIRQKTSLWRCVCFPESKESTEKVANFSNVGCEDADNSWIACYFVQWDEVGVVEFSRHLNQLLSHLNAGNICALLRFPDWLSDMVLHLIQNRQYLKTSAISFGITLYDMENKVLFSMIGSPNCYFSFCCCIIASSLLCCTTLVSL